MAWSRWLGGRSVPTLGDDDDDGAPLAGAAAEAAFLVSTYEPIRWDGAVMGTEVAPAVDELPGGDLVAIRGDYLRWMQDARGWAKAALRSVEATGDPYREKVRVDDDLRRAAQAVLRAVTEDTPHAVVDGLAGYVARVRARAD